MADLNPQSPGTPEEREITIISHSNLFYWWPVWAVGFLLGILTYLDQHYLVTVPAGRGGAGGATVTVPGKDPATDREVLILPSGKHLPAREDPKDPNSPPAPLKLNIATGKGYG